MVPSMLFIDSITSHNTVRSLGGTSPSPSPTKINALVTNGVGPQNKARKRMERELPSKLAQVVLTTQYLDLLAVEAVPIH